MRQLCSTFAIHMNLKSNFLLIAASLCLIWPALLNGYPIIFFDTMGYLSAGNAALEWITGYDFGWNAKQITGLGAEISTKGDGFVSSARSVFYGAALVLSDALGGLWVALLLQAILIVVALRFAINHILEGAPLLLITCLILGISLFTPVAFFVCYLMPDIFAGLALLSLAVVAVYHDQMGRKETLFWVVLLILSLIFHASHLALAMVVFVAGMSITILVMGVKHASKPILFIMLAILSALAAQSLFSFAVEKAYGHPPLRPPFIMARTIEQTAGQAYLTQTCPDNGFVVCQFMDRMPLTNDEFLWSRDTETAAFSLATLETKQALIAEQMRFFFAVWQHDPAKQFWSALKGVGTQLAQFGLLEFTYSPQRKAYVGSHLPPEMQPNFYSSQLAQNTFPLGVADQIVKAAVYCSLFGLVWAFWLLLCLDMPDRASAEQRRRLILLTIIILGGLLANASITGILSTPHDRYQARVVWLLPLLTVLLIISVSRFGILKANLKSFKSGAP